MISRRFNVHQLIHKFLIGKMLIFTFTQILSLPTFIRASLVQDEYFEYSPTSSNWVATMS